MKVENSGLTKMKDVHTGECVETDMGIAIKTDETISGDEKRYCKVVWLEDGVLGSIDENLFVRAVDAKVVFR